MVIWDEKGALKMKKKIFRILGCILIMTMMTSMASFAQNSETAQIQPRWSYTNSTAENLRISSNGTATMTSVVTGYKGTTTKIKVIIDLQKYSGGSWKRVKTYMDVEDTWYALIEHTYSGLDKGYTYRMKCTYTVYSGSNYDKFTLYSKQVTY